jgi:hypothetical protein
VVEVTEEHTGGSWWSLLSIADEARMLLASYRGIGYIACTHDGEPLRMGAPQAPGVRHCRFCGARY